MVKALKAKYEEEAFAMEQIEGSLKLKMEKEELIRRTLTEVLTSKRLAALIPNSVINFIRELLDDETAALSKLFKPLRSDIQRVD